MNRFSFILIIFFISCSSNKKITTVFIHKNASNFKMVKNDLKNWYHKDILKDTIPGISLERVYQELLKNKKGKEVIVAVLDMQIDINHEDLKDAIWINKDEIPNNNIDDDNNGYIDDINGWNFIGNKNGESLFNANFEYIRIIKKYWNKFENLTLDEVETEDKLKFKVYKRALSEYNEELSIRNNNLKNLINWGERYKTTKNVLKEYFPKDNYTIEKLNKIKTKDSVKITAIKKLNNYLKTNKNEKWLNEKINLQKTYLNYFLNVNYEDRHLIGDDINNINDKYYGNNKVNINQNNLTHHATYVAGLIAANRNNNIGIKGFSNNITIMPIVIAPNGDERDKDVALAIRYAVDNGAKIINMSSKKNYSINKKWVQDALKYAEINNVLFVNCSSNDSFNTDVIETFPTDVNKKGEEIITNFINVGSSWYQLDKYFYSYFSNYGKINVDLFAPGEDIFTTEVNNKYTFKNGTSFSAPIVTGVAALILSYYPNLKANQVKDILLTSGVSYDIDVEITDENGKKKLVPFSSLSKSGKIVNAYNALLYAKNYKKWKKGKWKNTQN